VIGIFVQRKCIKSSDAPSITGRREMFSVNLIIYLLTDSY